ncbi:MAG: hydroxymethylbilane synthase [Bacillaceae bacterium]
MRKIIVGSRRSKLALTQTKWVIAQLKALGAPFEFEIKEVVTKGDVILDVTLSKVGGKGLFVKEIEQALLNKEIDFAVHSMKDMPAVLPEGLMIGCVPKREDPRDVIITKNGRKLAELEAGAIIGTSSLRRSCQIQALHEDKEIKWIRGNIDSRLRKLKEDEYDAIMLASAGLRRMGWADDIVTEYLSVEQCIPAVGQGALGIECRQDDEEVLAFLRLLNDEQTFQMVETERAFLKTLDGGCQIPIGAYAFEQDGGIQLHCIVGSHDGKVLLRESVHGNDPVALGIQAANLLLKRGAGELIRETKENLGQ